MKKVKESPYRRICFTKHERKCILCDSDVVAVHHYDGDHSNNDVWNLVPLCMNHHTIYHSKRRHEIEQDIIDYRMEFIELLEGGEL